LKRHSAVANELVGDAVRSGVAAEGLKETGVEGCSGDQAVAASVYASSSVEVVDAAQDAGCNAVGSLSASRTGALNGCGCRAWRAFSTQEGTAD